MRRAMREKFAIANLRAKRAYFFIFLHLSNSPPPTPIQKKGSTPLSYDTDNIYVVHKKIITYESKHVIYLCK